MFCHKCGTKIAEGAGFCHKCGANLTANQTSTQVPAEAAEYTTAKADTLTPSIRDDSRGEAFDKRISFSTYKNTDRNKSNGSGSVVLSDKKLLISGSRIERGTDNKPKPRADGTAGTIEGSEEILLPGISGIRIIKPSLLLLVAFLLIDVIMSIFVIVNFDSFLYVMSRDMTSLIGGILLFTAMIVMPIAAWFTLSNKKYIVRFTKNDGHSSDVFITKKEIHDAELLIQMLNRK